MIFPCSGGSDVGELSDKAARLLGKSCGKSMYCLAGIGGKVAPIINNTKLADNIIVIDGCPVECAKKTLESAGINEFQYFRLDELGFAKGHTTIDDCNIEKVVDLINTPK